MQALSRDRLESIVSEIKGVEIVDLSIPSIKIHIGAPRSSIDRLDAEGVIRAKTAARSRYNFYRVQNAQ